MRTHLLILAIAAAAGATSCKSLECADGTIEQDDKCVPADVTVGSASCGAFTELQGDVCVPMFPPTTCDPATTTASTDPDTGVTTCIGNGTSGGCTGAFACPTPAAGKQTACGQIFDLTTGAPFQADSPTGAACAIGSGSSGPCALAIEAFDAIAFASNPLTATPLDVGKLVIDDCGRFAVEDITEPSGPLVALGIDDAAAADRGPGGITQPVGIAFPAQANVAVPNLEDFVVASTTTDEWATSGGPTVNAGLEVAIYLASKTGSATAANIQVTKSGFVDTTDATYFGSDEPTRTDVNLTATQTGINGTALVINGQVTSLYSGTGSGLGSNCVYESHNGAAVPGIVFVQTYRPEDGSGGTCAQ